MNSNELEIFKQSILDEVRVMMQTTGQVTQYIGARYVPLFADPIEWNDQREYEPLTIVTNQGNSYTSRQFVPKGVPITNEMFWATTGNYNAQIEQYINQVKQYAQEVDTMRVDISNLSNKVETISSQDYIRLSKMEGNNDDERFSNALKISKASGKTILVDMNITLNNALVVNEDDVIKIRGLQTTTLNAPTITCNSNFIEGSTINTKLTPVYCYIEKIYVKFAGQKRTAFKGVALQSSWITNSLFYNPNWFLEGSTLYATRIMNNRVQGFKYGVFSGCVFKDKTQNPYDMDFTQNFLKSGEISACPNIYPYEGKLSDDMWIDNNYFSGDINFSVSNKSCILFAPIDTDRDTRFTSNWMEFIYYFIRPSHINSDVNYGFRVESNTIQYCVTMLQDANYSKFIFDSNDFDAFMKAEYEKVMGPTALAEDDFAVFKLTDKIFRDIVLTNNSLEKVKWFIHYLQTGTSHKFFVKESNTSCGDYSFKSLLEYISIVYYIGDHNSSESGSMLPFTFSNFDSISNRFIKNISELPDIEENQPQVKNIFSDTVFNYPGGIKHVTFSSQYGKLMYV